MKNKEIPKDERIKWVRIYDDIVSTWELSNEREK